MLIPRHECSNPVTLVLPYGNFFLPEISFCRERNTNNHDPETGVVELSKVTKTAIYTELAGNGARQNHIWRIVSEF